MKRVLVSVEFVLKNEMIRACWLLSKILLNGRTTWLFFISHLFSPSTTNRKTSRLSSKYGVWCACRSRDLPEDILSWVLMFSRWHGSEGGSGGTCAALQRKALQSSVQGCDDHLGWGKLGALDVIWSRHCTNGKIEAWGSTCLRSHNHMKKSVSNLGFFGLFKGCQDRQRK